MSKWKDDHIKIVQIIPYILGGYKKGSSSLVDGTIGLGSDSRIYEWCFAEGKWQKGWDLGNE